MAHDGFQGGGISALEGRPSVAQGETLGVDGEREFDPPRRGDGRSKSCSDMVLRCCPSRAERGFSRSGSSPGFHPGLLTAAPPGLGGRNTLESILSHRHLFSGFV